MVNRRRSSGHNEEPMRSPKELAEEQLRDLIAQIGESMEPFCHHCHHRHHQHNIYHRDCIHESDYDRFATVDAGRAAEDHLLHCADILEVDVRKHEQFIIDTIIDWYISSLSSGYHYFLLFTISVAASSLSSNSQFFLRIFFFYPLPHREIEYSLN